MWQHFWFKPNTLSPDVARSLRSPEIQIVKFVQCKKKDQSGKFVEPQKTMKPGVILAGQKKGNYFVGATRSNYFGYYFR